MSEQDNEAETPTESRESRLRGAGFVNSMGFWQEPNGERTFTTDDAIAALDAGEIKPFTIPWPGVHPDTAAAFRTSEEEMDRILGRNQPQPEEPPPLPSWAAPWAELVAKLLKPIIRAEIRAALRKEREREQRHREKATGRGGWRGSA
jgi:hypothetical protein